MQPFETKLGIRWQYDKTSGIYFPVDEFQNGKIYQPVAPGDAREGYCSIALLPNLGGTGRALLVSATGGSALNAAADFLADNAAVTALRAKLPATSTSSFPDFEALLRLSGRSSLPRDASIVLCRGLPKHP